MNRERQWIDWMNAFLPRSSEQQNSVHGADAEIVTWRGKAMLFSMDEFSDEDQWRRTHPFDLGWNCAVGALSDIFAAGGKPVFYAHSLVVDADWKRPVLEKFSQGVAAALKQSGTAFIGGDFGMAKQWRYCAAVIGEPWRKPVQRKGARPGDRIFLSGKIGLGNIEAMLNLYSRKRLLQPWLKNLRTCFALRFREAELISRFASAATDTSDGVLAALNGLAEISGTGYRVRDLPYVRSGLVAAQCLGLPPLLLIVGECGEYELLFTVREKNVPDFLKAASAKHLRFYTLGEIAPAGIRRVADGGREVDFSQYQLHARDFDDVKTYVRAATDFVRKGAR